MTKKVKSDLSKIAEKEKSKREAELVIANEEKAKRSAELVVAKADKAKRAAESVIANAEKAKRALELVIANAEKEKRKDELIIADKELVYQNEEKAKREAELAITDINKAKRAAELVIAKIEKAKRIAKLIIADKELSFQSEEKAKREAELVIADTEKAKRASELVIANINKAKRAAELVIANVEKAKRTAELVIANKELVYQKSEKAKRAAELIIANVEKAKRAAELVIANIEKSKRAAEIVFMHKELVLAKENEKLIIELTIVNKELTRQIGKRKQIELKLKESNEKYLKAFQSSPYSITISKLENGKIIDVNDAFTSIFGYIREEAIANSTIGLDIWVNIEDRKRVISALRSGKLVEGKEFEFRKKNGEIRTGLFSAKIIYFNKESYNISSIEDITERKLAENELQKSKDLLNETGHMARVGGWEIDLFGNILAWTEETFHIHELSTENQPDVAEAINYYHPKDRDMVASAVEKTIKYGLPFDFESRLITAKGNHIWVRASGKAVSQKGKIIGVRGSIQNITDRKQIEIELIKAKEKAEESDRLKTAFLNNMSHEIRTPMNGILGFAKLLQKPNLTSEKQHEFIEIIGISGERMLDTINNIVDISKIEAGLMSVDISEANINMQIEFIYKFFTPKAEKKGVQLSFNNGLSSNEAIIKTDSGKINSILTNLVNNAIKYTDEGSVEFGYTKKEKFLEFFVKDTGIGIPKDRQHAIFERFIQADIEDNCAFQGSGLGLTICKSYVEMLGGKIWVESEEGLNSIFYFTIPYTIDSEDKNVINNAVPADDNEVKIKNLKILIAEDEEASTLFLTEALQEISHKIIYAETGVEAIDACRNNPDLDLILMDIRMPEMDGYEATRQIRLFNTKIIIIAQTAHAFAVDKKMAIKAGCNDYISKPISQDELLTLIQSYFNK